MKKRNLIWILAFAALSIMAIVVNVQGRNGAWDSWNQFLAKTQTWTGVQTFSSMVATTADINAGTVDATVGGTTPAAGSFTNLVITGNTTIGNATGDTLTYHPSAWTLTNNVSITGTWTDLGTVTTADIDGGTLDGVTVGGASAAAGTFTTLSLSGDVTSTSNTDAKPQYTFTNTADGEDGPKFYWNMDSGSPANNDRIASWFFRGRDSGGSDTPDYLEIRARTALVTDGDEHGRFDVTMIMDGAMRNVFDINAYGQGVVNDGTITFNEDSQDFDFIVESDNLADAISMRGSDGQMTIGVLGSGDVQSDANGVLSVTSDIRQKNVIRNVSATLAEVTQLQGIVWKWKEGLGHDTIDEYVGFSAQDVRDVFPELVYSEYGTVIPHRPAVPAEYDSEGNMTKAAIAEQTARVERKSGMLSVNRVGLLAHMAEAFKEVESRLEALEARLAGCGCD